MRYTASDPASTTTTPLQLKLEFRFHVLPARRLFRLTLLRCATVLAPFRQLSAVLPTLGFGPLLRIGHLRQEAAPQARRQCRETRLHRQRARRRIPHDQARRPVLSRPGGRPARSRRAGALREPGDSRSDPRKRRAGIGSALREQQLRDARAELLHPGGAEPARRRRRDARACSRQSTVRFSRYSMGLGHRSGRAWDACRDKPGRLTA